MANRPIFPDTIQNAALDIENADGTTAQDLLTAGTNGSRINSISATSDEPTADIELTINYNDGTTDYIIGSVTIPALAGIDGTVPPVSILNAIDMPFLAEDLSYYLAGADKITIAAQTAVTSSQKIQLVATYGDY